MAKSANGWRPALSSRSTATGVTGTPVNGVSNTVTVSRPGALPTRTGAPRTVVG